MGNADGTGTAASFSYPSGIAADSAGNLYVADYANYTIRKISPTGVVTTFAGKAGITGTQDGVGTNASFSGPGGVAVDAEGNVYVSDSRVNTIRKISPAGVVSTLAGVAGTPGKADGPGTTATFDNPGGLAVDSAGTLYVADSYNHTIRRITPQGVVSTLAGGVQGGADGIGSAAQFAQPWGLALDSAGDIIVADMGNHAIRKVTPSGVVTTLAGRFRVSGSADGMGTAATFNWPTDVVAHSDGNIYISDSMNYTLRRLSATGAVSTLAGTPGVLGHSDGTGAAAKFGQPQGITVDRAGQLYVTDNVYGDVRKLSTAGVVMTFAGAAGSYGWADGHSGTAVFTNLIGAVSDSTGNLFVADQRNYVIRKITPSGLVSTFAGTPGIPAVSWESNDGTGAAARFFGPWRLAIDSAGNLYVTDGNYVVRKITPGGAVSTLAGSPNSSGHADGVGTAATFYGVDGVATDNAGNVYVSEWGNNAIRKITPDAVVTTLTSGALNWPHGMCVDGTGNLYVADTYNYTVRKVSPSGLVTTLAGQAGTAGYQDGVGSDAKFNRPMDVACDSTGNIYVADTDNHLIRKISAAGVVTTLAGTFGSKGFTPGNLPGILSTPMGLALHGTSLYFTSNHGVASITNLQ